MIENHPSVVEPLLTPEHLDHFCQQILSVAYGSLEDTVTAYDTAYTRGTVLFGRQQGLCRVMSADKDLPWFELRNSTMDFTVSVDGVLIQVVTDSPFEMKKHHRIRPNPLEQDQLGLFDVSPEVCLWRLYLSGNDDLDFPQFDVTAMGFDESLNVVCRWKHEHKSGVSVRAMEQHPQVDVEEAQPRRKKKDLDRNTDKPLGEE